MMYRVISAFNDLLDGGHLYKVGDVYPRAGTQPTDKRIKELATSDNKQGKPLIEITEKVVDEIEENGEIRPARKKRGKKNENY